MSMPASEARQVLKGKIEAVESQLMAALAEARASYAQSTDKGTSVEHAFRGFLRNYLPRRLEVGHGEVIDRKGNRSAQTDVVIANEDHPLFFSTGAPGLFLVEGVSGAGEVKSLLTSEHLRSAIKNSLSFKILEASGTNTLFSTTDSDARRYHRCPPWFLFAFESQLSLDSIREQIVSAASLQNVDRVAIVDAVFIPSRGWLINFGDAKGSYSFRLPDGTLVEGWVQRESNSVLFDFLAWLSAVMPRVIRFRPILTDYMVEGVP